MSIGTIQRCVGVLLVALICGGFAAPAGATVGDASLYVAGASSTPTHWDIPTGVLTTAELRGVTTADVGGPLPATLTVWVKSSAFGNTMVTATRIGMTSDYTFDYTPPMDACDTTIVAYIYIGYLANNDLTDDGLPNGSGIAAAGLRITDGSGTPINCPVSIDSDTWGKVKALYR